MTFDVVYIHEQYESVILSDVTRPEALEFVEEHICPGLFSGRRFEKVALHNYASFDKIATVKIRANKENRNEFNHT